MRFKTSPAIRKAACAVINLDKNTSAQQYQQAHEKLLETLQLFWLKNDFKSVGASPDLVSDLHNLSGNKVTFFYHKSQLIKPTPAMQYVRALLLLCGLRHNESAHDLADAHLLFKTSAAANYPAAQYALGYIYNVAGKHQLAKKYIEVAKHNRYSLPCTTIDDAMAPARLLSINTPNHPTSKRNKILGKRPASIALPLYNKTLFCNGYSHYRASELEAAKTLQTLKSTVSPDSAPLLSSPKQIK